MMVLHKALKKNELTKKKTMKHEGFFHFLSPQKDIKKVASPLVTSHFLTWLSPPLFCISGGEQSQLRFVELFPRGDHGC